MPIHSQSTLTAGLGLPCSTAHSAATVKQSINSPTAASVHPKRTASFGRPMAPSIQNTPSAIQSMTTVSPSPWVAADSLGKSGRATQSAVMPPSSQGRSRR